MKIFGTEITEHLAVHIGGSSIGLILLYMAFQYKSILYGIPGLLWFITNMFFLLKGPNAFKGIVDNKTLFTVFFMIIPAFVMAPLVIYETYRYNHIFIRYAAMLVLLIDLYHAYQMNPIWLLIVFVVLITLRGLRQVHFDDLHPLLESSKNYIEKSDILFVIPNYKSMAITEDKEFIKYMKKLEASGKELAMHGVTHSPQGYTSVCEFGFPRSREYIEKGVTIFKRAFGHAPKKFKAPCYNLHPVNKKHLEDMNIQVEEVDTLFFNRLFHSSTQENILMNIFNKINEYI